MIPEHNATTPMSRESAKDITRTIIVELTQEVESLTGRIDELERAIYFDGDTYPETRAQLTRLKSRRVRAKLKAEALSTLLEEI